MSALLLLGDLYLRRREADSAFEVLLEAWTELKGRDGRGQRDGHGQRDRAASMVGVAGRVLEIVVSSLPLQTRSLFDAVTGAVCLP